MDADVGIGLEIGPVELGAGGPLEARNPKRTSRIPRPAATQLPESVRLTQTESAVGRTELLLVPVAGKHCRGEGKMVKRALDFLSCCCSLLLPLFVAFE